MCWKHPNWSRGFLWAPDATLFSPSTTLTEINEPLLDIPINELHNTVALTTLKTHSHLFKIVTPIHVDHFKLLLKSHPNYPLIMSVCKGLHEVFWPFMKFDQYAPETWDKFSRVINEVNLEFALQ